MKDFLIELYAQHSTIIIFLHIVSSVVWVGGMITMRFVEHYSFRMIKDGKVKLTHSLYSLKRLFIVVLPFVLILILTAVVMIIGLGFKSAAVDINGNIINTYAMQLYNIIHIKESIWMIMTLNLVLMAIFRNKAEKYIENDNINSAKKLADLIAKYMVPLNIILGLIAIYLGVTLRDGY
jgi:uncharacterized membrane protein